MIVCAWMQTNRITRNHCVCARMRNVKGGRGTLVTHVAIEELNHFGAPELIAVLLAAVVSTKGIRYAKGELC